MDSLLILVPLFSLMVLNLAFQKAMKRIAFGWAVFLVLAQVCLALLPSASFWSSPINLFSGLFKFDLGVDALSLLLLLCIGIVSFVTLLVARAMIQDPDRRFNFINLVLFSLIGMNGVALVKDIFSLYVFMEISAAVSFIMIAFDKDRLAFEGAFKYLIFSVIATVLMLSAIGLLLFISGSTSFVVIRDAIMDAGRSNMVIFAIAIFLCGLFIKSGIMPFHGWLPDAYSAAPAAVSVFLAGIVTKALGVYSLIRVVYYVFGLSSSLQVFLLAIGAVSVVLGSLCALTQTNMKRMFAYSSISQVGYIILGLGSGSVLGLAGAMFHFFNHAVFKSLLFVNCAAIEKQAGTTDMDKLGGISKSMPFTAITNLLASLSISGVPPLAGFWSKLVIVVALFISGHYIYAVIAVLASLLTLAYMLSVQRNI
ncbi:MAG: NADH-quinone oxidoreductase subunit L, partial [Candidatus Omnitrophica bacterium]|nr:NADH-quinone oxidoreductase subunit L [Candidatus Omnitrophota bacterium]